MSDDDSPKWDQFLSTGDFSDFTIVCGDREFKVHRVVLCAQSRYFRAACKEESFKEGTSRRLELQEDPEVFEGVLSFLYTGDYKIPGNGRFTFPEKIRDNAADYNEDEEVQDCNVSASEEETNAKPPAAEELAVLANWHVQIYASAERLCLPKLKKLAAERFSKRLSCLKYLKDIKEKGKVIAAIIPEVYQTTSSVDRELRDILAERIVKTPSLFAEDDLASIFTGFESCAWDVMVRFNERRRRLAKLFREHARCRNWDLWTCDIYEEHQQINLKCRNCGTKYSLEQGMDEV